MIYNEDYISMDVYSDILNDHTNCIYINSVFLPLKQMSSRKKGKFFERIVREWFTKKLGFDVSDPKSSNHDFVLDELKIEVKGSFLWEGSQGFKFQQIRVNQDYDLIVFVSVYPDHIQIHACTKETVKQNLEIQDGSGKWLYQQHGGKAGKGDVLWWSGFPSTTSWMNQIRTKEDFLSLIGA